MFRTALARSAVLPLVFVFGCATSQEPMPASVAARERAWQELDRVKAELWERNFEPVEFDLAGEGHVRVRQWFLEGGPGWEYVRARFTWQNTTGRPIDEAIVTLVVRNHDGTRQTAGKVRLVHPWGLTLNPGTFFAQEVRTQTHGIHWDPQGWTWEIQVKTKDGTWRVAAQ
jgi:hypothetical protein